MTEDPTPEPELRRDGPMLSSLPGLFGYKTCFHPIQSLSGEDEEQMLLDTVEAALQIHIHSRPLLRLPPIKRWSASTRQAWKSAMIAFAIVLDKGIEDFIRTQKALPFLNILLDFFRLTWDRHHPRFEPHALQWEVDR